MSSPVITWLDGTMDGSQDCDTVLTAKRSNLNIPPQYMPEGPCIPKIFQVRPGPV
jgi:hypothetical protein